MTRAAMVVPEWTQHELKCWPTPFDAVWEGVKPYEIRVNDRNFQVGDVLWLREWDPFAHEYSGRSIRARVSYMTPGGAFGLPANLCVMGLADRVKYQEAA